MRKCIARFQFANLYRKVNDNDPVVPNLQNLLLKWDTLVAPLTKKKKDEEEKTQGAGKAEAKPSSRKNGA